MKTVKAKLSVYTTALSIVLCLALVACSFDQILTDVDLAIQMASSLESAIGGISPADAEFVKHIANLASAGLAAVRTTYDAYKASGAASDLDKVKAVAKALQDNLAQELAAAHISNPAVVQKVTAWVGLINTTLVAVLGLVAEVNGRGKVRATAPVPDPASLKSQWLQNVCQGDASCGDLVKIHKVKQ